MIDQTLLAYIKTFFLEYTDLDARHSYAATLPEATRQSLLTLEEAFFTFPVKSQKISQLLELNGWQSLEKEVTRIQSDFYLGVYGRFEESGVSADHLRLVENKNESYLFLYDAEGFEEDLRILINRQQLDTIRQQVQQFEKERQNMASAGEKPLGVRRSFVRYASWVAAACAILAIWQPFHSTNEEIYGLYFPDGYHGNPSPVASKKPSMQMDAYRDEEEAVRGEVSADTTLSRLEQAQLEAALELFADKRYMAAITIFDSLQISTRKGASYLLTQAIARMHTGNFEQATKELKQVIASNRPDQEDEARFYLSLCYIKENKRSEARFHLKALSTKSGKYQEMSKNILSELRWF